MTSFSVIVPTYHSAAFVSRCVDSFANQVGSIDSAEYLFVDDCSDDETPNVICEEIERSGLNGKVFSTLMNGGPGCARNTGIDHATGDWVLFVDSDDQLDRNCLSRLKELIDTADTDTDIVAFDWRYLDGETGSPSHSGGRQDFISLRKPRNELLNDYLSMWMGHSAIYTAMRREFLVDKRIAFRSGLHEDVDFLFNAYLQARGVATLEVPLYYKHDRPNSIVNSFTVQHVNGFFTAYDEIYAMLLQHEELTSHLESYKRGLAALTFTMLRRARKTASPKFKRKLYECIFADLVRIVELFDSLTPKFATKYFQATEAFLERMRKEPTDLVAGLDEYISDIDKKTWSCFDLHHSLFLGPDEIRACCKRFFVKNEQKGDVVLLKLGNEAIEAGDIAKRRAQLHQELNKGICEECIGCPFLEFKKWGSIDASPITYVSFEYHSKCTMKCQYCSDKYYGGKSPVYDVRALVKDMVDKGCLDGCNRVVWGGGEPTLDRNFAEIFSLVDESVPSIRQKVITNATIFEPSLKQALDRDRAQIMVSLDAGTAQTFRDVHRTTVSFERVLENVSEYASKRPRNVTLKYILLDDNTALRELRHFVETIKEKRLEGCNFQISVDFRNPRVSTEIFEAAVVLYGMLYAESARFLFFDDLFYQRLDYFGLSAFRMARNWLEALGLERALADPDRFEGLVIWGAGDKTGELMKRSAFLASLSTRIHIIDDSDAKIGSTLEGCRVHSIDLLDQTQYPVFISSYIHGPDILNRYLELGYYFDRVARELVL